MHAHRRDRVRAAMLSLALVGLPRFAFADDQHARAAESFREGQAAFERHEFSSAAAAFEVAAGFEPKAVSLLDAADAWTRAREPVRAAQDCDRALAMPAISDAERAYANELLSKNEKQVATIRVAAKSTVTFVLDGGDELHAPLQRRASPGAHTIDWKNLVSGAHAHQDIVLGRGQIQNLTPPFSDAPSSNHTSTPPPPIAPPPDTKFRVRGELDFCGYFGCGGRMRERVRCADARRTKRFQCAADLANA